MFSNERSSYRKAFILAWRKHQNEQILDPLESVIVEVIIKHPEYHALLSRGEDILDSDFEGDGGEQNPFLHMGMHIGLLEQLNTNRPLGLQLAYKKLRVQTGDAHTADHMVMECLANVMWQAQRNGQMPDEQLYLSCVQKLIK